MSQSAQCRSEEKRQTRETRSASSQHVDRRAPAADAQRCLQGFDHALAIGSGETDAILDHFEHDARAAIRWRLRLCAASFASASLGRWAGLRLAASEHARVALLRQQFQYFGLAEVVGHRHRESHYEPAVAHAGSAQALADLRVDALRRVAAHRRTAVAAVQLRGSRKQQLEMIVQLRHGADGRTRRPHWIGLVDGDRRRDALDALDLRTVHAVEELPRVRRERLDVTALAFGVDRVEHQRGLARARYAGDDDQLVRRQLEIEILQVVLARAADDDGLGHGTV